MAPIQPDRDGRLALNEVWYWMSPLTGAKALEEYETDQLERLAADLDRALTAVRRHIVRRGDE
jgi:hypothetical protein